MPGPTDRRKRSWFSCQTGINCPLGGMNGKRESAMGLRKLRVYTGPETDSASLSLLGESTDPHTVRVTLGEILPTLADAVASDRTWLTDFEADEVTISSDLHDVLQAYRHFRRPGA
jgi:hypothetical protein